MKLFSVCMLIIGLTGCATTGFHTSNGGAFISDFSEGLAVSSNSEANKKGEACSTNIMGIYSHGDATIEAAKKAGGISKVASIDTKIFAVRPFYGKVCTIVHGN